MRPISYLFAGIAGCALATAGFVALSRGPAVPVAFAQSAGTCCAPPPPTTAVLLDGPSTSRVDPASEAASASLQAVCATAPVNVSQYRTLVVHVGVSATTVVPQFRSGKAGFVTATNPNIPAAAVTPAGIRGNAVVLDATMGRDFRLVVPPDTKTGNCPGEIKVDVVGVR